MITVAEIQSAVAASYNIPVEMMRSRNREREYCWPRQEAMFLCRRLVCHGCAPQHPISFPEIGRKFGNRDHTTVIYAMQAVEQRRKANPMLRIRMRRLALELRGRS